MVNYIKNHRVAFLIVGIITLSIIKIASEFYSGYSAVPYYVMSLFSTEPIRYILVVICVITVIIGKELNRNRKALIFIALALLLAIGLIPDGHFVTLGALISINNVNPKQFRDDAREMLNEYEPDTLFSDSPQRNLDQVQVPRNKIPPSILKANIGDMLVLKDNVFVEKFGLLGLFRGFIVFREGSDIWKNDKAFTLLDDCSYCWKIRVIDGLYWYHAVPTEEEIATVAYPLK